MTRTPFRLGYFTRFGPTGWQAADDRLYGDGWWTGGHHIALAQRVEASGGFDFMFFDDTAAVSTSAGGTMDADLRLAIQSPRHDAIPLLPLLARATKHLGVVSTASTSFYPPFILSRLLSTVDHLTNGRVGWNVVTSSEDAQAQNHGMDKLPPHDERYAIADEFLEVATALWEAYEPDALVRDITNNAYIDPKKVRHIDHHGKYFKVRGPLNVLPSPQRKPVIMQAGGSERGRDFAAKHADAIFTPPSGGLAGMKAARDDLRARAEKFGRDPDDIKVFYAALMNILPPGQTEAPPATPSQIEYGLLMTSKSLNVDLTKHDPNKPLDPHSIETRGSTAQLAPLHAAFKQGKPLGQTVVDQWLGGDALNLTGSPQEIGRKMMEAMDYVGGDGFLLIGCDVANGAFDDSVIDGLVPFLQDQGVVRTSYKPDMTLRQTLRQRDWVRVDEPV